MRFTAVWSQTLSQNVTLRVLLFGLTATTLFLGASTARLALREPLIVERGCVSTSAKLGSTKHTDAEVEAFVQHALSKRFDSKALDTATVLSSDEYAFRLKEQQELQTRGLTQRVLVNHVTVEGSSVKVDSDRILTSETLRTAVAFPLTLELGQTDRSPANPYGLVLTRASQSNPKEASK